VKFGYKILLFSLVFLIVTGFASADRLPSQVPENQMITISTIIDCIGPVSDSSSISWVLDDQSIEHTTATNIDSQNYYSLTSTQIAALKAAGVDVSSTANGGIQSIDVPSSMLSDTLPSGVQDPTTGLITYQDLVNAIENTGSDSYDLDTYEDRGSIHDSKLNPTESIMLMTWTDSIRTNGGHTSLNKNIDFDSKNKVDGMNNLEVEKVLTYESIEGSHLNGAESYTLDVAGNYKATEDSIRCVFASASSDYLPAFCNVVKAKSELINVNSAQISTKGAVRGVAATADVPAALSYQIAVTPDSNSGSGFADGTIKTFFGGSIMEARDKNQVPSATNTWKDTASVTGGIKNFQKTFNYESGFSY